MVAVQQTIGPSPLIASFHSHGTSTAFFSSRVLSSRRKWNVKCTQTANAGSEKQQLMNELAEFLKHDLPHLFDEQGIDRSRYDERVDFIDPITRYDTISGYLFNIQLLRFLFGPEFFLHDIQQTGQNELTTRWTMRMNFKLLPWNPELIFTGTSAMRVNFESGKFCSHVDKWDSVTNNEYFSLEAAIDFLKQLRMYKTPDLETPKYKTLKRTKDYEVRKYEPFSVAESKGEGLAGSKGFNNIAGYIFGKNAEEQKIKMTTPVFTERNDDSDQIQIVIPSQYTISELPAPTSSDVKLRHVPGGYAAVLKFSGKPEEKIVMEKENYLRSSLLRDNLKPVSSSMLARYNDPGRTPAWLMRNEVLIWLEEYEL